MSKFIVIALLWITNFSLAIAQDFRPGFILKLDGDSVAGFIKNGSMKGNSRFCYFQSTKKSDKIKYSPVEIKGYGITDDKYFEAKNISKKGREPEYSFLEVLVKGKMSLYKYVGSFYLEMDSLFALSKAPVREVIVEGRTYNSTVLKYVPVLNYLMLDCNLKADNVGYSEKSLVNLVQDYNRCKGTLGLIYKTKKIWTKLSFSIFTGIDQASVKLDGFDRHAFKQSVSVPFGMGIELSAPRLSDKSYFSLELWYDKKFLQGYSEVSANGSINRSDFFINASYIKMPVGLRFNLLPEANTPYVRVGFAHYFLFNESGTVVSETEKNGVITTNRSNAMVNKRNSNGFWGGIGYSKKINRTFIGYIEVRYEKNSGFTSPEVSSKSSGDTISFLIGLKF